MEVRLPQGSEEIGGTPFVVAQLLHPKNFTLWFVFWFLLAGLGLAVGGALRIVSLAPLSVVALGVSFLFLLVLVFDLGLLFRFGI